MKKEVSIYCNIGWTLASLTLPDGQLKPTSDTITSVNRPCRGCAHWFAKGTHDKYGIKHTVPLNQLKLEQSLIDTKRLTGNPDNQRLIVATCDVKSEQLVDTDS